MSRFWDTVSLGQIADIVGGGTPSRGEDSYFGGSIPWVTPTDLPPIGMIRSLGPTAESITEAGLKKSSARLVPPGSVLFSSRASIGKIAVTDRVCSTNQGFANFIPRSDVVDGWFLAFLLSAHIDDISRLAGETTFKEVSKSKLREFKVRLPRDLYEQRRIVSRIRDLMDRVEEVHALRREVRRDVARLFSSALSYVFCENWPTRRLEEVAQDIRNGWSGKELHSAPPVRVLRLSAVHTLTIDPAQSREVHVRPADIGTFCVRRGDVFVVRGNGSKHLVGRSAIAAGEDAGLIFNDLLIRVNPEPSVLLPEFLNYCLHTLPVRRQIEESAKTAAGIWKINQGTLGNVRIPCPSLDTQLQVVQRARELHERCRSLMAGVDSRVTEHLSAAVLRKAFAGEL